MSEDLKMATDSITTSFMYSSMFNCESEIIPIYLYSLHVKDSWFNTWKRHKPGLSGSNSAFSGGSRINGLGLMLNLYQIQCARSCAVFISFGTQRRERDRDDGNDITVPLVLQVWSHNTPYSQWKMKLPNYFNPGLNELIWQDGLGPWKGQMITKWQVYVSSLRTFTQIKYLR